MRAAQQLRLPLRPRVAPVRALHGQRSAAATVPAGAASVADDAGAPDYLDNERLPPEIRRRLELAYNAGFASGVQSGLSTPASSVDGDADAGPAAPAGAAAKGGGKHSLLRSVVKGTVWRFVSSGVTVALAWALLHDSIDLKAAFAVGGAEFAAKLALYVAYERIWIALE